MASMLRACMLDLKTFRKELDCSILYFVVKNDPECLSNASRRISIFLKDGSRHFANGIRSRLRNRYKNRSFETLVERTWVCAERCKGRMELSATRMLLVL
jgi:hypothetical protein